MFGIIKGDIRYTYLSQMIDSVISDKLSDFNNIDKLLLPMNGISSDYFIKQTDINLLDIINSNRIKVIYTGNANKELIELCDNKNIKLYQFLKDNEFLIDNGLLTAKGLIYFLNGGNTDIKDYKIAVLGYGYIAYQLCKILKEYKCDFSVYTLNEIEKKYAMLEDYRLINKIDSEYNLILNTIPYNIECDYSLLKNSKIVDVASSPYGFDINKIIDNKIDYEIISAIPSKYAMKSAAYLIKKFIENNN